MGETLFASDNLDVRLICSAAPAQGLLVYFAPFEPVPDPEKAFAGGRFLAGLGVDVAMVVARDNRWFQYPEMAACRAVLARIGAAYPLRLAYGISMGGYEAIRAAEALGCARVLAIAPQYSIDAAKVPFETRWRREAAAIDFIDDALRLPQGIPCHLLFDPREPLDAAQMRHILATGGVACPVAVPFATHFVSHFLAETGQAAPLLRDFIAGSLDRGALRRRLRGARAGSITYLAALLHRLGARQGARSAALRQALMQRIAGLDSDIARNQYGKSRVLARLGRHAEALEAAERAVALKPGHPQFTRHRDSLRS